jgi:hypothetical protein
MWDGFAPDAPTGTSRRLPVPADRYEQKDTDVFDDGGDNPDPSGVHVRLLGPYCYWRRWGGC